MMIFLRFFSIIILASVMVLSLFQDMPPRIKVILMILLSIPLSYAIGG
jgi:hypothetical protein